MIFSQSNNRRNSVRMHPSGSIKQAFFKKWVLGLQICYSPKKNMMSFLERKKAIKLSADIAMASTRNTNTFWSRALISNALRDNIDSKVLVEHIVGTESETLKKASNNIISVKYYCNKRLRSNKVLKKSLSVSRVLKKIKPKMVVAASSLAKRLVKKRTQVLKSLVPGGESMDEFSLIEETLDYIVSLRAQVDVMRRLAMAHVQSI